MVRILLALLFVTLAVYWIVLYPPFVIADLVVRDHADGILYSSVYGWFPHDSGWYGMYAMIAVPWWLLLGLVWRYNQDVPR